MTNQIRFAKSGVISRWIALSFVVCLALYFLGPGLTVAKDKEATIITFDVPGAFFTFPQDINPEGVITGFYLGMLTVDDPSTFGLYGFIRYPDNTFTTYNGPDSSALGNLTEGINPAGEVAGSYFDVLGSCHGFAREPDGTFTTFDVSGATNTGTAGACGTVPLSINNAGVISGYWVDQGGVWHGFVREPQGHHGFVREPQGHHVFVREPQGHITSFDAPDAFFGTIANNPDGINPEGTISGYYIDAHFVYHGFVRDKHGEITEFDAPGAGTAVGTGTVGSAINPDGAITGWYMDNDGVNHGYMRDKHGNFTTFDVTGAGTGNGQGTIAYGINPSGEITGQYLDGNGVTHGFVRDKHGKITTFDVQVKGTAQPTHPYVINPAGVITGQYLDANGTAHGFLRIPKI